MVSPRREDAHRMSRDVRRGAGGVRGAQHDRRAALPRRRPRPLHCVLSDRRRPYRWLRPWAIPSA